MPDRAEPRWLDAASAAAYVSVRVDQLPRLLRAGKLPQPSRHLGPRKPRYDRIAIDALFEGVAGNDRAEEAAIVQSIIERADRQKAAGGRHGQGISLRTKADRAGEPARAG